MPTTAKLDTDSLHRVEQGNSLVAVKGSLVLRDDALGERRMRFQMTGDDLVAWSTANSQGQRKGLLKAFVQKEIQRTMKQWREEPPTKVGIPIDETEEFDSDIGPIA